MIGLRATNDNGIIKVFDNSSLVNSFTRAIIELPILGLRKELNAGTTPTIGTFLSPSSLIGVEFPAELDDIVTIKYTLLSPINPSGLSYVVGDNLVYKNGIFNATAGTDYIYIDRLYSIDKEQSSSDMLFLIEPIQANASEVYIAFYLEKCIAAMNKIPCEIKELTFNMHDSCCDDVTKNKLDSVYRYLAAINVQQDCNDCRKLKELMYRLKSLLGIC